MAGSFSFGIGECTADAGSLLPWQVCATGIECLSNDCIFDGSDAVQLHTRGHCTLDTARLARYNCRCQTDAECQSGTCAGDLFDQDNHRCTADAGTVLAGDACHR